MEKVPSTPMTTESIPLDNTLWIYDQFDHVVSIRRDMTAEDVPMAAVTIKQ